jgi:hypothetical protein
MPIRNFNESLKRVKNGVTARGPLGKHEKIMEICAWVIQAGEDGSDAAATEMESGERGRERIENPNGEWSLPLTRISRAELRNGTAFAAGMALIEIDSDEGKKERVSIWAELVRLTGR